MELLSTSSTSCHKRQHNLPHSSPQDTLLFCDLWWGAFKNHHFIIVQDSLDDDWQPSVMDNGIAFGPNPTWT